VRTYREPSNFWLALLRNPVFLVIGAVVVLVVGMLLGRALFPVVETLPVVVTATVPGPVVTTAVTVPGPTVTVTVSPVSQPTDSETAQPSAEAPTSTRTCPYDEPLTPVQLANAGASCAWGYVEYCDCV